MGAGHKHNNLVPMAATETSAAAACVRRAVQEQLVCLPWYHASKCMPLLATHNVSRQECAPDLIIAARGFVHGLPCRLRCVTITISLTT